LWLDFIVISLKLLIADLCVCAHIMCCCTYT